MPEESVASKAAKKQEKASRKKARRQRWLDSPELPMPRVENYDYVNEIGREKPLGKKRQAAWQERFGMNLARVDAGRYYCSWCDDQGGLRHRDMSCTEDEFFDAVKAIWQKYAAK